MWVSLGYKKQNDPESQLRNPTYMDNAVNIVNGIFNVVKPPINFATATSHVFETKNNHTSNSILNHQCSNWLNWRWKITLNIIATFFCRFYHVQSSAERPWLDMLARSDPTIDGQMIYIYIYRRKALGASYSTNSNRAWGPEMGDMWKAKNVYRW